MSRRVAGGRKGAVLAAFCFFLGLMSPWSPTRLEAQENVLDTIREDVRTPSPGPRPAEARSAERCRDQETYTRQDPESDAADDSWMGVLYLGGAAATSPFWGPFALLGDDFGVQGYFPRFPYDHTRGYMMIDDFPSRPRQWAARLDAEYVENCRDPHAFGGHLLVSTSSRFGFAGSLARLEERLARGGRDQLWLGDANLVFRFAQSQRAEFRAGLGMNWLDDATQTDLGFNFTYGADFFPRKPWVVSSTLDWGTLGHAELFRFRATAGIVVHGVEVYAGYQYLDIDRIQTNGLVGAVRVWF